MTSATREVLVATSEFCSVAIALAVSSERLFSAAWAPIASDTKPTKAAATVTERREMRSCLTSIIQFPIVDRGTVQTARQLVAPVPFRFEGLRFHVPSNCAQFAAPQQTIP